MALAVFRSASFRTGGTDRTAAVDRTEEDFRTAAVFGKDTDFGYPYKAASVRRNSEPPESAVQSALRGQQSAPRFGE